MKLTVTHKSRGGGVEEGEERIHLFRYIRDNSEGEELNGRPVLEDGRRPTVMTAHLIRLDFDSRPRDPVVRIDSIVCLLRDTSVSTQET